MLFTLRVLSGEMSGSELLLSAERYIIKTGKQFHDPGTATNMDDASAITLFIPCGNTGNAYYLDLRDKNTASDKNNNNTATTSGHYYSFINVSSPDSEKTRLAAFNDIEQIDDLIIAVKEHSENWSESVIEYVVPAQKSLITTTEEKKLKQKNNVKKWAIAASIILFSCMLGGVAWFNKPPSEQKIKKSLADTIAGSVNPVSIIKGNKNTYYLLAATQRDFDWILQALQRNPRPDNEKIEVILLAEEPEQLTNRFWNKNYPVLTVDLSLPLSPVIKIVTGSALTQDQLKEIKALALEWIPFAQNPVIKTYNKNALLSQAENSLKLIYLPFAKLSTPQGATFSIRGELNDHELLQLNEFINTYKKEWGTRYINFDIKLENNLLKGKSYLNGEEGYVLMGKSHWYFPSI